MHRPRLITSPKPDVHLQCQPCISLPLALQPGSSTVGVQQGSVGNQVYGQRVLLNGRGPVLLKIGSVASCPVKLCIPWQAAEQESM